MKLSDEEELKRVDDGEYYTVPAEEKIDQESEQTLLSGSEAKLNEIADLLSSIDNEGMFRRQMSFSLRIGGHFCGN